VIVDNLNILGFSAAPFKATSPLPTLTPRRPMREAAVMNCMIAGRPAPESLIAPMADSAALLDDPAALRARLAADGYLFLRSVLDAGAVRAARAEVLARLAAVGEIAPDTDGRFTGASRRKEIVGDLGAFWRSVSEGPALRAVTHGAPARRIMAALAGEDVRPHDFLYLRVAVPGRATGIHYDYPFFTRAHDRVWTVWTPIGDAPTERGPLVVVEGSHRFHDLIEPMLGFDVARDTHRKAALGIDAVALAQTRGARLLTADFAAGDLAIFGMYTAHGSLDHHDPAGIVRVSCDLRWQPASLPVDERYFGDNPGGTTGAGYGELNGAKPLTQDWHVR
jgi:ectoine hydroxylase-related dioxygenase (phytanoyl-CoA dioxygenase family)